MTSSYTQWTDEGVSPFICNLEFNKSAQLERRRGTEELFDIKAVDSSYIRTLAVGYVKVRTTGFAIGDNTVVDIGIVSYAVAVTPTGSSVKYYVFALDNSLEFTQSPFSSFETLDPNYAPFPSFQLGLQTMALPTEPNIFYVLRNTKTPSNTNGFNILSFTIAPTNPSGPVDNEATMQITIQSGISGNFGTAQGNIPPSIRVLSTQRAMTSGINRLFVGEGNVLYYSANIDTSGAVVKVLNEYSVFKDTDTIVKIIEFDNFVFVITNQALYKGAVNSTGDLVFSTVSNNIYALNSSSILVVGNFCYIPTLDSNIYKINLKGSNLEIDTYSDKIGEQTVALVENAYPRQSYYDNHNSTLNFIYSGNIYGATSLLSPYSSQLTQNNTGTIQSIILSKHYLSANGAPESWTSMVLHDEDIAGGMNFTTRLSAVFTKPQNSYIPKTLSELSCTDENLTRNSYSDAATQEFMSQTVLVHDRSGKIVHMTPRTRLDLGVPFKVGVCCPMIIKNIQYIEQFKRYSCKQFSAIITTDESQSTYMYPEKTDSNVNNIMTSYTVHFTGDLSKEVKVSQTDESKLISQDKSVVMHIKTKLNTHLPNSGVMCIFKSSDIRTFIGFRISD